ncbi:SDR family oxidoreductase [Desulfohalobium retbaense]|uniref:NmrA family protein n=1 Tax=Desulfohalobium retbaense (strain ATCC 49708 / DSM 5692 / JCM 16813 / HR100) TaxID=485915 RepID=C8X2G3_DESRD|nr:SDR family oxidoreductase [Desulfohalobium retbaense]ACV68610.1 NmrA family protein [Desulfohalobium retbaense DSM 5692]
MPEHESAKPVLVLGATGYVGGRLVPLLLERGYRVRAAGRSLEKLSCRPFADHPAIELVQADVLEETSLLEAAQGCRAVYYLVHSMAPQIQDFAETDRIAARNMVRAAEAAGMEQIIYLGGLGDDDEDLSHHLLSRLEVGRILQEGSVPCTFLRAAMILGAGSASFELMRYLVERLPVMLTPRWVQSRCQPIAISNVLEYLTGVLDNPPALGQTLDIGGPDIVTYAELFRLYAEEAGLRRRLIIPVPVFSPKLSSYWIHLVTPVPATLARPLTEGLRNTVVCQDTRIREMVPQDLLTCREAIRRSLDRVRQQQVATCWFDAGQATEPEWVSCEDAYYAGGTILECSFRTVIAADPEEVWQPIRRIGGDTGWYYGDRLWWLRGLMDRLLGGVGLRRGRRDPEEIRVGDGLDFWRVLDVQENSRLQLLAEMKLPGEAVLEFRLHSLGPGRTELVQAASFLPRGLWGMLYWYALAPSHVFIFKGMLQEIAAAIDRPILTPPTRVAAQRRDSCRLPGA